MPAPIGQLPGLVVVDASRCGQGHEPLFPRRSPDRQHLTCEGILIIGLRPREPGDPEISEGYRCHGNRELTYPVPKAASCHCSALRGGWLWSRRRNHGRSAVPRGLEDETTATRIRDQDSE